MSLIKKYLEEKKSYKAEARDPGDTNDDGTGEDVVSSSDYKLDKHGKKYKAHRIVFNKGEDDGKKSVAEELKGNQHKLDKNKNGKLDAHDFKLLHKEEDEEMSDAQMKKREDYVKGMKKNYKSFVDKYGKDRAKNVMYATATKMAMKEEQVEEGWDDMKAMAKKAIEKQKTSTLTKHDVKKTDTGTVYTKQRDPDGMSKEFKRDNSEVKRGRGRPKKNQFAEAVEFIMSLDEQEYDELMTEGFDAFFDAYLEASIEEGYDVHVIDEAQDRSSSSYQFTHKPGDAESDKKLSDLKKSVKGTGKRVVLQGRLGKNNPNAHKYSKNAPEAEYKNGKRTNADVSGKAGAHSHQRIQKADAAHHDVYVYNR